MKPMNACPLNVNKYDKVINNPNYIIEEKLKGIRATIRFGTNTNLIISRGGHNINHRFPHIASATYPELYGKVLDGELFQHGIEDEIIAGWGNHNTKHIDPNITKDVIFYYFDVLDVHAPLRVRKDIIYNYSNVISKPFTCLTWWDNINNLAINLYNQIIKDGGEGIMLKSLNSYYYPGKRPQNTWYKMKKTQTFDVIVTGFELAKEISIKKGDKEPTKTKFNGLIGAFTYGMYTSDHNKVITLGSCSGMDDATRIDMTNNTQEWLGKVIEIEGVEQKASGAIDNPRFKRLRIDKEPSDCIWIKESK